MSTGAAFLDYDNDGFQDLFVVNGTRLEYQPKEARNRLFHNELGAGGARVFRQVEADLGVGGWGMDALRGTTTTTAMSICTLRIGVPTNSGATTGRAALPKLPLLPEWMTGAGALAPPLAMSMATGGSICT